MSEQDELLQDEEHAKLKGFDNVFDWYLACLNAEINILLDPELRTDNRLDELVKQVKVYIEKLAKVKQHYEQKRLDRPEMLLEADSILRKISWFQNKWLSFDKKDRHFIIKQILALVPDIEEAKKQERERIISELKKRLVTTGGLIEPNGKDLTVLVCFRQDDWLWQALKGEK